MKLHHNAIATLSTLLVGTHFGIFLAWVCTTMWGLDAVDPRIAITAMQAMNTSVRNAVFFPVFFLPPVFLLITAAFVWHPAGPRVAGLFGAAGFLVLFGSVVLTGTVNVPMNEALDQLTVPQDLDSARAIWLAYSPDWQFWNGMRTIASAVSTLLALIALQMLPRD